MLVTKVIAAILLASTSWLGCAQALSVLPPKAEAAKRTAARLAPNAPISVLRMHGEDAYGRFQSCDDAGLTFYDIDRKENVTLQYVEVKKIKNSYSGYNSIRQKHTDHTKSRVIVLAVVGALVGVIIAAATAKN